MTEPPRCVFCRRQPMDPAWRPFCSERCKMQDLARWADGGYGVPGDKLPEPPDGAGSPGRDDQDDKSPR